MVSLLVSVTALAQEVPQLGKNSIDEVLSAMTLEEKIRFVSGIGMADTGGNGAVIGRIEGKVPGASGATVAIERLGIPSVILADGPAGLRIDPVMVDGKKQYTTAFPVGTAIASSWNKTLAQEVGRAMGNEVSEYGVDIILAPGMNIIRNPLCGRNFEYYSEDPVLTAGIASGIVSGIQEYKVGTAVKHFTGNNQETNREKINDLMSERALREIYLLPFELTLTKANPWTIMTSYNKINGTYTCESAELLTNILRNQWQYEGVVMTDWFAGEDQAKQVAAGNDLIMPGGEVNATRIKEAIEKGTLAEADLNRNIKRILALVLQSRTFANYAYTNKPNLTQNGQTSLKAAQEGMILLKNEKGTLPFAVGKMALLGNASYDTGTGGTGSGEIQTAHTVTFYEGLGKAGFQLSAALNDEYLAFVKDEKAKRPEQTQMFEKLQDIPELSISTTRLETMATENDYALITIGRVAGEGYDRSRDTDYYLRPKELELIRNTAKAFHNKGKKVVVALNIDALTDTTQWRDLVDAIIITWLPGQEAGTALANIITGKENPSGKLTQTMALQYEDIPSASTFGGTPKDNPTDADYNEGIYVGYRHFATKKQSVAYPFGHGLSYTTFKMSSLKVNFKNPTLQLSVKVRNTGKVAGKEVVQVYVSAPAKTTDKPAIELKAFEKTTLLQPKGKQQIEIEIPIDRLSSWDSTRSTWVVEAGTYTVRVGTSAENLLLTATFTIPQEIVVNYN